jgi:hypothetical protein
MRDRGNFIASFKKRESAKAFHHQVCACCLSCHAIPHGTQVEQVAYPHQKYSISTVLILIEYGKNQLTRHKKISYLELLEMRLKFNGIT